MIWFNNLLDTEVSETGFKFSAARLSPFLNIQEMLVVRKSLVSEPGSTRWNVACNLGAGCNVCDNDTLFEYTIKYIIGSRRFRWIYCLWVFLVRLSSRGGNGKPSEVPNIEYLKRYLVNRSCYDYFYLILLRFFQQYIVLSNCYLIKTCEGYLTTLEVFFQ